MISRETLLARNVTLLAAALVLARAAGAAPVTEWNFSSANGDEATFAATGGDAANFNLASSVVTRGANAGASSAHPGALWFDGWSGALDKDAYFQFSVNPLSGVQYNISDVSITPVFETSGPDHVSLFSDRDGYATALDPSAVDFTGLTSPVTFRLFLFGNDGGAGGVSDISIDGDVTVSHERGGQNVPESFPTWAAGLVIASLAAGRAIRHRQPSTQPARIRRNPVR
jgi:hypothetical protein